MVQPSRLPCFTKPTLRAVIYCRVSTLIQHDEGTSLETQEIDAREYCRSKGYEVLDVVQEIHTGADLNERSKLSYVRDMIKRRQADVLVVWKFDRLSRDMTHQAVIHFEAEQVGGTP